MPSPPLEAHRSGCSLPTSFHCGRDGLAEARERAPWLDPTITQSAHRWGACVTASAGGRLATLGEREGIFTGASEIRRSNPPKSPRPQRVCGEWQGRRERLAGTLPTIPAQPRGPHGERLAKVLRRSSHPQGGGGSAKNPRSNPRAVPLSPAKWPLVALKSGLFSARIPLRA